MSSNLVNLNVNPCKMCMPMGAVSALYGIKGCMPMLHGSQGCATYIRRHMATHYNEPVDIASSSLTEEGTVFGGEANLLAGLRNMIELYNPEVIGICTTCLAETIGEDVGAIVKKFYEQNPGTNVKIINIASPGYGGTQNEGWFAAIRAVLASCLDIEANDYNLNPYSSRAIISKIITELKQQKESGEKSSANILRQGDLKLDSARHIAFCGNKKLDLFATEFAILKHLLANPNIVFSRSELIKAIRGPNYPVTERSVDVQIRGLRKKIGKTGKMIEAVRGVGYCLRSPEEKNAAVNVNMPDIKLKCRVNVIVPQLSPADNRWLKKLLTALGVEFIMFPDLSDNLDGCTENQYNRLKTEGVSLSEIASMVGADLTLEFSEFIDKKLSPAEYLKEAYNIPFVRLPLPAGIRAMDRLISVLKDQGAIITDDLKKERGRYLDAMIDSHKHCSEARAAIYGDPDFVAAMVRLCCENGILPALAATGSVTPKLCEALQQEFESCKSYHLDNETGHNAGVVMDDSDFAEIEEVCREKKVNILIGSSDGRRIARRLNIPLIRCAFPIHDYIGGQRVRVLGFEGSLNILDGVANAMIEKTESTYRTELYGKYFHFSQNKKTEPTLSVTAAQYANIAAKTATHPCFGEHACKNARVHLPVAPECNIQCNYCLRNYDCMNESRPGVASKILTMTEALERYIKLKQSMPNLTVVGVAGPGDALASFEKTRETLRLIRGYDPSVTFCIATNGLLLPQYVPELIALGVSHVTITVNAVDPAIGAKIYKHINYMGKTYTGVEGASILLANQLAGIKMLSDAGMICKVNCVILKGINDHHVDEITKIVAEIGAFMTNIMPHIPVKGSAFEDLERLTNKEIAAIREQCGAHIKQMTHCRQCRSDAAGTLDNDISTQLTMSNEQVAMSNEQASLSDNKALDNNMRKFAVATKGGKIVDTHFGQAEEFVIYESDGDVVRLIEKREVNKYCNGPDCEDGIARNPESRWEGVIRAVSDCEAVLSLRIGTTPEKRLKENGIEVITTYEKVETAVRKAAMKLRAVGVLK